MSIVLRDFLKYTKLLKDIPSLYSDFKLFGKCVVFSGLQGTAIKLLNIKSISLMGFLNYI